MKRSVVVGAVTVGLIALSAGSCSRGGVPETEEEKVLHEIGRGLGRGLAVLELSPRELEVVLLGVSEGAQGITADHDMKTYPTKEIAELGEKRKAAHAAREEVRGREYLAKALGERGAVKLETGAVYRELAPGKGDRPVDASRVTVNYRAYLTDGTLIEDTYARKWPLEFPIGIEVAPCWVDALKRMRAGGKSRIACPSTQASAAGQASYLVPGSTIVFEFELVSVVGGGE